MKIYLSKINEDWIIDRVKKEWLAHNPKISTKSIFNSDIIWIISPWLWEKISKKKLSQKKVLCSIYHIDFEKFTKDDEKKFRLLDKFVDQFHVISKKTEISLRSLTDKKITSIPLWVNQNYWFPIKGKQELKKQFGFSELDFLVGSFQRDTEGSDLVSPKLIKGPDIFVESVLKLREINDNLKVVLAGKRRQYVIKRLEENNVPYKYFEMATLEELNKLYNILDLYIVSSRLEGGPQAIVECAITKTPIVSTDVGIASEILSPESIYKIDNFIKARPNTEIAYNNAKKLTIPDGMNPYRKLFQDLYED